MNTGLGCWVSSDCTIYAFSRCSCSKMTKWLYSGTAFEGIVKDRELSEAFSAMFLSLCMSLWWISLSSNVPGNEWVRLHLLSWPRRFTCPDVYYNSMRFDITEWRIKRHIQCNRYIVHPKMKILALLTYYHLVSIFLSFAGHTIWGEFFKNILATYNAIYWMWVRTGAIMYS